MKCYKISDIADIQSGLVLSRKASKESVGLSLLDMSSLESYEANEPIDKSFLTQENDIIIRLFAPVCATLIKKEHVGFVVPSQLAIIRIRENGVILPGYLSVYLSNERG